MMGMELPEELMRKLGAAMKSQMDEEFDKAHDFEPLGQAPDNIIAIFKDAVAKASEAHKLIKEADHLKEKAWIMIKDAVGLYDAYLKCDWEGDRIIYNVTKKPDVDDESVE